MRQAQQGFESSVLKSRRLMLAVIIIFSLTYLWVAIGLGLIAYSIPGAGLFPVLAAVLTVVASTIALFESVISAQDSEEPIQNWRRLLSYAIVIGAWAGLFPHLGFLLSSGIAIFAILKIAENESFLKSIVVAAISLLVSWLLFEKLLAVPLPVGLLFR